MKTRSFLNAALIILILTAWPLTHASGFAIVNNSSTAVTPEDSLCIGFFNLDSLGKNIGGLDTTKVIVFNPGGDSVFCEVIAGAAGRIKMSIDNGDTSYRWVAQVSDIDGNGQIGQYCVKLGAKSDQTGAWLKTPRIFYFQLVSREFDDALVMTIDSLQAVINTLQNLDNWVGNIRYTNPDSVLTLRRALISGANSTNASLYIENSNGTGAIIKGNGTGSYDLSGNIHGNLSGSVGSVAESVLIDISGNLPYADTIANRVLEDSSHYKGQGGGGDSTSVARWVWNTPQNHHTQTGTFGKYLDTEISGIGSGSGLYSCRLMVVDSTVGQIIPGVKIVVRNLSQTALIASGSTDFDGYAGFNLDLDTFLVIPFAPGYIFESYDTLLVTGAGTDTIYGYRFDPGAPTLPEICRVYGFLFDISGGREKGAAITAWLPSGVSRVGAGIISPFRKSTVSDSTGYFYLDLIPSINLIPGNGKYEITITRTDGTILRERITVPNISRWLLTW